MQIYFESLHAIGQTTQQLDRVRCVHCNRAHQLVSHGFVYKKQRGAPPLAVGKRAFCSNRNSRVGCGRTTQLYLNETIRYLHYAGSVVVAFILLLMAGESIARAYTYATHATSATNPRHAYRWLNGLCAQLSTYRSLLHQPPLLNDADEPNSAQDTLWETRCASSDPSWVITDLYRPSTPSFQQPLTQKPVRLQLLLATIKVLIAHCGVPFCNAYQQLRQRPFLDAVTAVCPNTIVHT